MREHSMSSSISTKRFYVYTLGHPNGMIFYVGKGSGKRVQSHLGEARKGDCHCDKCKFIRKIWKDKLEVQIEIVFETDSGSEALEQERACIYRLRRTNPLCNWQGYDHPRAPHQATAMSLAEYAAHLSYFDLTKKERRWLMEEWGSLRILGLEKQWRAARRLGKLDEAELLVQEIESIAAAAGRVWQLSLPFDSKKAGRKW